MIPGHADLGLPEELPHLSCRTLDLSELLAWKGSRRTRMTDPRINIKAHCGPPIRWMASLSCMYFIIFLS